MNELLLIALLSATSPVEPCCPRPAAMFVADSESKEMTDRVAHFIVPMAATTSVYGAAMYLGAERKEARWIAAGFGVVLVIAKEVYDHSVAGRFGLEEAAIGFAGTAAGVYVGEKIEWE